MEVRKNTAQVTTTTTTTTTTMDTSTTYTASATAKDDPAFWLPTHFLTDEDFLDGVVVDDYKLNKEHPNSKRSFSNMGFGFDHFEAMDSPVSSDGFGDKEDHELLAELTRQLSLRHTHHPNYAHAHAHAHAQAPNEKAWMLSTSPKSTLSSGLGTWSHRSHNGPSSKVPSPPVTPPGLKDEAAWELLYEAAGQVARLKMNAMAAQLNHLRNHNRHHHYHQQLQNRGIIQNNSSLYTPTPNQRNPMHGHYRSGPHHRHQSGGSEMRAVFLGGAEAGHGAGQAVKRQSTGTGVFIPRRSGTQQQPEPRKKPPVLLPARVVQALKLDLDEINNGKNHNSHSRFGSEFVTDRDVMVARRSAALNQQRRNLKGETMMGLSHDIRLPNDWTY